MLARPVDSAAPNSPATRADAAPRDKEEGLFSSIALYVAAALAEIAGCFSFWAWLRLHKSPAWLVPGMLSLAAFAFLLTRVDSAFAGRAYAAYGGVYIASSLLWLWVVEQRAPDRWDLVGGAVCLLGAAVILWGPRGG